MKNRLKAFGIQEISIIQKFSLSLGGYHQSHTLKDFCLKTLLTCAVQSGP